MSKEAPKQPQNIQLKPQTPSNAHQQGIQLPPQLQQQISALNARINNLNLAQSDLLREMDTALKGMAFTIVSLQKENAQLKAAKTAEPPKAQQP